MPKFLIEGGWVIWVIMAASAMAVAVFLDRLLQYHREQINSGEFLNGVRNVLKRDNVVEALAICDATPGPVARLVKVAILNRERGRFAVQEALEDAGAWEVPRLEQKLNLLATIAQIAPLHGPAWHGAGLYEYVRGLKDAGLNAQVSQLFGGIGRRSSARRRDWRWPFPVTPAIITWSGASTPSFWTWNKYPARF